MRQQRKPRGEGQLDMSQKQIHEWLRKIRKKIFVSQGLFKMQIKQGNTSSHLWDWQKCKGFLISRAGVGEGEKNTHLRILSFKLELYTLFRGRLTVNIWLCFPFDRSYHFQESFLQTVFQVYKDTWTLTAVWPVIARNQRQSKCPTVREFLKKLWQIHTICYSRFSIQEYYLATKKNEVHLCEKQRSLSKIIIVEWHKEGAKPLCQALFSELYINSSI